MGRCSVADPDPGSGVFLTPASKIKIPILFSKAYLRLNILKCFDGDVDPGSGIFLKFDPGLKDPDPDVYP
jgi:hypothetical protein